MYKLEGILCDNACSDRRSSAVREGGGTMDNLRLSRTKIRTSFSPCLADNKNSLSNASALPKLPDAAAGVAPSNSEGAPPLPSTEKDLGTEHSVLAAAVATCRGDDDNGDRVCRESRCNDDDADGSGWGPLS
jgi:hypothetical protein